jgi:hypothetical protein
VVNLGVMAIGHPLLIASHQLSQGRRMKRAGGI